MPLNPKAVDVLAEIISSHAEQNKKLHERKDMLLMTGYDLLAEGISDHKTYDFRNRAQAWIQEVQSFLGSRQGSTD